MNRKPPPLLGRRIVVTRARTQSAELIAKLETMGAEVLAMPVIETVPPASFAPLDQALTSLSQFPWLVVTSANAVRVLRDRMRRLGLRPGAVPTLQCAAVGIATANALVAAGFPAPLVPEASVGDALAEVLRPRVAGARVLLVRAETARDVVPEVLRAAGAEVLVIDAYRTIAAPDAPAQARALFGSARRPDAVTFTSSSTVTHFLAALRSAELPTPPPGVHAVSIGPVTSATLRDAGWPPSAEAVSATMDTLAAACAASQPR